MSAHIPPRVAPFYDLIGEHLSRPLTPTVYARECQQDPDWGVPRLYVPMFEALLAKVQSSNPAVKIDDVRRADTLASGHSDYQRRLALSCANLAGV